jgi:hypothetical protein
MVLTNIGESIGPEKKAPEDLANRDNGSNDTPYEPREWVYDPATNRML